MNLCFLIGEVISNIEFQFVLESQYIAIAKFEIQLENGGKIKIRAYDELADWCYFKLRKKDYIILQGELNTEMEIILHSIHYFQE